MSTREYLRRNIWDPPLVLPALLLVFVIAVTALVDRQQVREAETSRRDASALAERQAAQLADELGNVLSARIGALSSVKVDLAVDDADPEAPAPAEALDEAVNQLGRDFPGIASVSVIDADGTIIRGRGALLGLAGASMEEDTVVSNPYLRSLRTGDQSASAVLDHPLGRRIFIFSPVPDEETGEVMALVAGELDPGTVLRVAMLNLDIEELRDAVYSVRGAGGARITTVPAPAGWPAIDRTVRLADTEWSIRFAYPPFNERAHQVARLAIWGIGVLIAFGLSLSLFLLRRQLRVLHAAVERQRQEIRRRESAEQDARRLAGELADRARALEKAEELARGRERQARDLAGQLRAAQEASQRLSTSLDSEDVVELFLGVVAERLEADVATLYLFDEEGETLIGRKRVVFHDLGEITDRLRAEDVREIRAPVALLPGLAEAVATGEPTIRDREAEREKPGINLGHGSEGASTSLVLPLLVGGHVVGVASWDLLTESRCFDPGTVTFAQSLGATAAAALHTAELFSSLEGARRVARREASRFGAILDQMADGVVIVDSRGRVERSNEAAVDLLGKQLLDVEIDEWVETFDLVGPEGRPLARSDLPLQRALAGEDVRRVDFVRKSLWGDDRHFSGSAAQIRSSSGETGGAALVFRDITDERQYAEMLRHTNRQLQEQADILATVNRQLREATKAKDQFLAVMSHELRTPINAVIGYSELLDMEVKGSLNGDQKAMLGRIRETSNHLLGLINQVLDLAKMASGQMEAVVAPVDVEEVVQRCVNQLEPLAHGKGLHLRIDAPSGNDLRVLADETRLSQIILNLLSNAIKFTDEGTVLLRYRRVGDRLKLAVKDSGPGVALDQQEQIFEEFYQAEGDLARKAGGTGLGLPIARRLARLMDGDISLRSAQGQGTVFVVTLPIAAGEGEEEEGASVRRLAALCRSERLLECLREGISGETVVSGTTDPSEIYRLARGEVPEKVLVDLGLPDNGAWRALEALRDDSRTERIPVTLMVCDEERECRAFSLGTFPVLGKPVSLEHVIDRVQNLVRKRSDYTAVVSADDPDLRRIVGEALAAVGCSVRGVADRSEADRALQQKVPDVLLIDLMMAEGEAFHILAQLRTVPHLRDMPVVAFMSREISLDEMNVLGRAADQVLRLWQSELRPIGEVVDDSMRPVGSGRRASKRVA